MQYNTKPDLKIKFVDWHSAGVAMSKRGDVVDNFVLEALKKYYNVQISENPDIVFCGIYGYEYKKHDCIRVFFCLEENLPNFNIYDELLYQVQNGGNFLRKCYRHWK